MKQDFYSCNPVNATSGNLSNVSYSKEAKKLNTKFFKWQENGKFLSDEILYTKNMYKYGQKEMYSIIQNSFYTMVAIMSKLSLQVTH